MFPKLVEDLSIGGLPLNLGLFSEGMNQKLLLAKPRLNEKALSGTTALVIARFRLFRFLQFVNACGLIFLKGNIRFSLPNQNPFKKVIAALCPD